MKILAFLVILAAVLVAAGVGVSTYKQKAQAAGQAVKNATAKALKSVKPAPANPPSATTLKPTTAPTPPVAMPSPTEQSAPKTSTDAASEALRRILAGENPGRLDTAEIPGVIEYASNQPNLRRLLGGEDIPNNR